MELPPAAYVILGMLRLGARSGYEIKRTVEVSTRFFWTISQAQIYPNLKRLEHAGLVSGRSEPQGRRPRRVYELTPEGEAALSEWLRRPEPLSFEFRDIGMLKLFFADALGRDEALELIAAIRRRSEEALGQMRRDSEPGATAMEQSGHPFPLVVLRLGMTLHQTLIDSCDTLEKELQPGARAPGPPG